MGVVKFCGFEGGNFGRMQDRFSNFQVHPSLLLHVELQFVSVVNVIYQFCLPKEI